MRRRRTLLVAKVSASGYLTVYNGSSSSVNVIIDVFDYYPAPTDGSEHDLHRHPDRCQVAAPDEVHGTGARSLRIGFSPWFQEGVIRCRAVRLRFKHCSLRPRSARSAAQRRRRPGAVSSPARSGTWKRSRSKRSHRKSRMDQRTRERMQVMPVLISTVNTAYKAAAERLHAAQAARSR